MRNTIIIILINLLWLAEHVPGLLEIKDKI